MASASIVNGAHRHVQNSLLNDFLKKSDNRFS